MPVMYNVEVNNVKIPIFFAVFKRFDINQQTSSTPNFGFSKVRFMNDIM